MVVVLVGAVGKRERCGRRGRLDWGVVDGEGGGVRLEDMRLRGLVDVNRILGAVEMSLMTGLVILEVGQYHFIN